MHGNRIISLVSGNRSKKKQEEKRKSERERDRKFLLDINKWQLVSLIAVHLMALKSKSHTLLYFFFLRSIKSLSAHYVSHTSGFFCFVFCIWMRKWPPFWKHLCQFHSLSFFLVTMRPLTLKSAVSFRKAQMNENSMRGASRLSHELNYTCPFLQQRSEEFWEMPGGCFFLRTSSFAMSWISWSNIARRTRLLSNIPALF